MYALLVDLASGVIVAVAGLLGGWWLRGRPAQPDPGHDEESRRAREILARLEQLAKHLAANVGEHSSRMTAIGAELNSAHGREPEVVVSAMAKLIQANEGMQQQLNSAEEKLGEQARLAETYAAEARTDALTGLANRRVFDEDLARRGAEFRRYGRPVGMLMIDIDHFKKCNDAHGHQAGDDVLRNVAAALHKTARSTDLVARYGGEEFAIIMPETTVAQAALSAERIRRAVEECRLRLRAVEIRVTVSVGAAEMQGGEEAASLLRRADAAMYASKNAGRNCSHWHDGQVMHRIATDHQDAPASAAATPDVPSRPLPPPQPAPVKAEIGAPRPADCAAPHAQPAAADIVRAPRDPRKPLFTRDEFCASLAQRLAEWRRGGETPAVLLVRIDHFPEIIVRWGNEAASMVIRAATQYLNAVIREIDMAADYAPGTFAILLPGASLTAVIGIGERLRQAIARWGMPLRGEPLKFTVSVAGAIATQSDEMPTLLRRSEATLDAAAQAGGNASFFHNGQCAETIAAVLQRACPSGGRENFLNSGGRSRDLRFVLGELVVSDPT